MTGESLRKKDLAGYLARIGAYETRVADPRTGFEHALPGRHPMEIFPQCRSVVVYIVPRTAWSNNNAVSVASTVAAEVAPERMPLSHRLFYSPGRTAVSIHELLSERVWFAGSNLLRANGHKVGHGYVQEKLCASEAGIGVYGRSGLIIHPVLGNRVSPGVLLTDAEFEPDPKIAGFDPCSGCGLCTEACPAGAYRNEGTYPGNWSKEACLAKRSQLADAGIYCHECFRACPTGNQADDELVSIRSLKSLGEAAESVTLGRNARAIGQGNIDTRNPIKIAFS